MNTKTNQNRTWLMLLLLLLVVAGFVQSVVALETKITVFSDDFNAGDFKVDWTVTTTGAGSFEPSTAKYVSEPYSVYMDSMGTSRASAVSPVYELDLNKDYYVSFYFLIPDSGNHWLEVFNNHQIYLVIDSGTQLKCYLGNNNSLLVTDLSTDHWYHIEIITKPSSSNYDVYIDGDLKRTCPFWIHAGFEDRFQIGDREGTSNDYGEAYWDDFLITQGTLIRVDCGATGNNDGTSWADAFTSLQDGLDRAVRSDRIWVAAGTYKPTNEVGGTGDRYKTFQMINHVAIYGGFAATGDPAWENRNPNTYVTILSGDLSGNDNLTTPVEDLLNDPNRAENCYHVFYHPSATNLDTTAVLDGFTITAGNSSNTGGGMCNDSNNSPKVANCTFSRNSAVYGGGMYNGSNCSPTVTNCTFSRNGTSNYGGGMCNSNGGNPIVTNCIFSGNSAEAFGGGIYNEVSSPIVTNCTFSGNSVYRNSMTSSIGGGMANVTCSPMLVNCTFTGNSVGPDVGEIAKYEKNSTQINILFISTSGGGMYNQGSNTTLVNCTFSGNYSSNRGGGMANYNCNPIVTNCILWGNTATSGPQIYNANATPTITYSDIAGDQSGTGDIDSDPLFIDADGSDNIPGTEDDNLQLAYNSPCIDAGDPNTPYDPGAIDLDEGPRFADGDCDSIFTVDMGAYEFDYSFQGSFDGDCDVDFFDFAIFSAAWMSSEGDPAWNEICDIGSPANRAIYLEDMEVLIRNWLDSW